MGLSFLSQIVLAVDAVTNGTTGGVMGVNGVLALGVGLAVLGAAAGIGRLAASAVESMARQPEAGGRIFTSMIIAAALIEGFTFFALVICMLGLVK
jgi:F-type H+-transporting ATPase subunit c